MEVGKVAVVDDSHVADAAEAIILGYANDAIIARDFFMAVGKHQAGAVRDKVAGLSKEGESIALGVVETELGAFLPVGHNGNVHHRDQRDSRFSKILEKLFSFSLLVLDLEPFQFHFHFSKKSEGILFFTFHFSKKVKAIRISLFFLEKKE